MKKLKSLARAKQHLLDKIKEFDLSNSIISKSEQLEKSKFLNPILSDCFDNIGQQFKILADQNNNMLSMLTDKIIDIEKEIDQIGNALTESDSYKFGFDEWCIHRTLPVTEDCRSWVNAKISHYADWHFPGLVLWPRNLQWFKSLVVSDPLYVTSLDDMTIEKLLSDYPESYQNRIRRYRPTESKNLKILPQQQFSIVFAWDFINYIKQDLIKQYLDQVFDLLRPGGSFIFSFTDCDIESSANTTDNLMTSFCTKRWLIETSKNIGYEIVNTVNFTTSDSLDGVVSVCELKRPGKLQTVKTFQSMARIIHRKEKVISKEYSAEEIEQLQNRAAELGIEHITMLRNNIYDPKVLEQKIKEKEKSLSNDIAKPK